MLHRYYQGNMSNYSKFLALACVLVLSFRAEAVSGGNPFDKRTRIFAGAGMDWTLVDEELRKSSANEAGTYYHLFISDDELRLRLSATSDPEQRRAYKSLAIEDLKVDGKRLPIFQWCLNNQPGNDRFLQQGLSVSQDICDNRGAEGEFILRLDDPTMQQLQQGKRLAFEIKPYRSRVEVNFNIADLAAAQAILEASKAPPEPPPVPASLMAAPKPTAPAVPVIKAEPVKMCDARAPAGYDISAESYVCNDPSDRIRAKKVITAAVNKEKARRAQVAQQQAERKRAAEEAERARQQALLEQQKAEAAEAAAIAASELNQQAIQNQLTEKMLGVCNKMWARGKHRCYCQKYIEHAPPDIQSSSTCNGDT